jgi:hypothetical protein
MKTNVHLPIAILLAVTFLTACTSPEVKNTLTACGVGKAYLDPDTAYVYITVHTRDLDVNAAIAQNGTQAQSIIAALANMGIAAENIRSTHFTIEPSEYDTVTRESLGTNYYNVDNNIIVTVDDLTTLSSLLTGAIQAGATNISQVLFDAADKTGAILEARTAAIQDAQERAAETARLSGVKLGGVHEITYDSSCPQPNIGFQRGGVIGGYGGGSEGGYQSILPINPGKLQVTVYASLVYEIK